MRKTFSEDRLRAALADLKTMTWREVSEKHGISPPTLSKYRRQMGGAGPATARQSRKTALALKPGQQAVHIDTTGPAAIDGLAGLGVVRIRIERELSIEQARGMLARLTPEQLGVALSAALTAGLEG